MPELPKKSNEFVAEKVPPPVNVVVLNPHHVHVQLFAEEMVALPNVTLSDIKDVWADELPVTSVRVVIVVVVLLGQRTVFPGDIVSVPIVLVVPLMMAGAVPLANVTVP